MAGRGEPFRDAEKFEILIQKVMGWEKTRKGVTPAKAGVQNNIILLVPRLRGDDPNGGRATFKVALMPSPPGERVGVRGKSL